MLQKQCRKVYTYVANMVTKFFKKELFFYKQGTKHVTEKLFRKKYNTLKED